MATRTKWNPTPEDIIERGDSPMERSSMILLRISGLTRAAFLKSTQGNGSPT